MLFKITPALTVADSKIYVGRGSKHYGGGGGEGGTVSLHLYQFFSEIPIKLKKG